MRLTERQSPFVKKLTDVFSLSDFTLSLALPFLSPTKIRSKHRNRSKERCLLGQNTTCEITG